MSEDNPGPTGALEIPDHEVVRFTREEWDRRAAVARASEAEIRGAIGSLKDVAEKNHYGDCAEGWMFHERAQAFVQGLRDTWTAQADQIGQLGAACEDAGQRLTEQDEQSGRDLTI